jgi:hypothetical protein
MRGARALSASIAAWGVVAVFAATASATLTHEPESFSPLDGSGSGVTIHEPSGIGLDEATGNVFITDGNGTPGEEEVLILGGEGGAPTGLISPFEIEGFDFNSNTPAALAYDNSATSPAKGTLYVYQRSVEKIKKFTRDSATENYKEEGTPIAASGVGGNAQGLGLDQAGDLYLGSLHAQAIYKFSPAGALLHKWSNPAELPLSSGPGQVAVDATGDLFIQGQGQGGVWRCSPGVGEVIEPASCEQLTTTVASGVAYDPANDHVFLALGSRIAEYDATSLAKISEFGIEGIAGELGLIGDTGRIAVDAESERIYVVDDGNGKKDVAVFGPAVVVPTTAAAPAEELAGTKATLKGTVNPEGIEVTECKFEYGKTSAYGSTAACEGLPPTDSDSHEVAAKIAGLKPNGGVYHYRLLTRNGHGTSRSGDETLTTLNTVATEAATEKDATTATLNGLLRPEGRAYTACKFEWGPTTVAGYAHEAECDPKASEIPEDFGVYHPQAQLTGLAENTTYKFRLLATNIEGTLEGSEFSFETLGPPVISEVRARDATQSGATIEAKIDPRGFDTSYYFEWGPTAGYSNSIPVSPEAIGSGTSPVGVSAVLGSLSVGTTYHYRLVAESGEGRIAETPDQTFETLNSCGLFEARCFEMVSPRIPFPAEQPGSFNFSAELRFQAAEQPGALVYSAEAGQEDATTGGRILYQGERGAGEAGWSSAQLSPPVTAPDRQKGTSSAPSSFYGFSKDLSCAVLAATQPLTDDPGGEAIVEAGGGNLYRRNPDGSYTLITAVPPEELQRHAVNLTGEFELIGMSSDCSKVVFATTNHYPGTGGVGSERLYEWEAGTGIRNVGVVPSEGGGEEAVAATGGNSKAGNQGNRLNAVSADGSRVFISATRLTGAVPGEKGKAGVFVREDGASSTDISASETAVPDEGAQYQGATPDGWRVYFTANAGLTSEASEAGTTDLYEYDFGKDTGERLTDLSATAAPGGARVGAAVNSSYGALVGMARDGSHVYFVARGQLLPGRGPTLIENEVDKTFSVYDYDAASEGASFVGVIGEGDLKNVTVADQATRTSRVSSDGRYLLFQSSVNVTGYDSSGVSEAYLYDAEAPAGTPATICISCRTDGNPPISHTTSRNTYQILFIPGIDSRYEPQALVVRDGRPEAFFLSQDKLAEGAIEGQENLYAWSHGQVLLLAPGAPLSLVTNFAGASEGGEDIYLYSAAALNWENPEGRPQAWDARIGGGFAGPPPPPAAPCDAGREGACGTAAAPPPAVPSGGSSIFNGPGNVKTKKKHQKTKKKHHKHHAKHHTKKKSQHGKKKQRKANRSRRAGK